VGVPASERISPFLMCSTSLQTSSVISPLTVNLPSGRSSITTSTAFRAFPAFSRIETVIVVNVITPVRVSVRMQPVAHSLAQCVSYFAIFERIASVIVLIAFVMSDYVFLEEVFTTDCTASALLFPSL